MSIELHCPQCQKLIRAPDNAGGRYGKCPCCGNKVYIPTPPEEEGELDLAPIDEDQEQRDRELRRESIKYASVVDHDTGDVGSAEIPGEVVDLGGEVETYIIAMRDSKLEVADAAAARLRTSGVRARDFVQAMLVDEMPLPIENVPPPVVQGFLKTLIARLK